MSKRELKEDVQRLKDEIERLWNVQHVGVNIYTKTPAFIGLVDGPHLTRDVVKAIVAFIEENFSQKLTDVHSTIKYAFKPKEEK